MICIFLQCDQLMSYVPARFSQIHPSQLKDDGHAQGKEIRAIVPGSRINERVWCLPRDHTGSSGFPFQKVPNPLPLQRFQQLAKKKRTNSFISLSFFGNNRAGFFNRWAKTRDRKWHDSTANSSALQQWLFRID